MVVVKYINIVVKDVNIDDVYINSHIWIVDNFMGGVYGLV
jgi:hypothetical protein